MLKKIIVVAVVFTLVFMIPVTVAGAIVSDPIGFIGEIILVKEIQIKYLMKLKIYMRNL